MKPKMRGVLIWLAPEKMGNVSKFTMATQRSILEIYEGGGLGLRMLLLRKSVDDSCFTLCLKGQKNAITSTICQKYEKNKKFI